MRRTIIEVHPEDSFHEAGCVGEEVRVKYDRGVWEKGDVSGFTYGPLSFLCPDARMIHHGIGSVHGTCFYAVKLSEPIK